MTYHQTHLGHRFRISTYVEDASKSWLSSHSQKLGISESHLLAQILQHFMKEHPTVDWTIFR